MSNKFYTDEEAQELQKLDVLICIIMNQVNLLNQGKMNIERQRIPLWLSLMVSGYGFLKEKVG